jgi:glycosyltransferase involved in cell wall biosynthesis
MHIVIANNIYPPIMAGGAELIVAWLSEGLVARGHRVTVVSTCGPEMQPYPVETANGVTVIRFFPRNVYWSFVREGQPSHRRALWHLRDAWNCDAGKRFHAIIAEAAPDIVHTHLIDGFSAAIWRRARRAGIPVVHTAHDYHLLCPRAFMLTRDWQICRRPSVACRLYRAWHTATARHVDLFVSPSRFLLDQHRAGGLPRMPTAIVPNGIPLPARSGTGARRTKFLLLARLTVEKGVRVALRAIAALPRTLDFQLVIAGRGPLETEIRQAAADDPRIRFVGYATGKAKQALLESARYLLIPSLWYENAPVAVIEAAAHGVAVIASRIGGLPEFVRDGRNGLLFEPGDATGLAAIMQGLLKGTLTLPDLATECRNLAEQHTVDRMVDAYLGHYGELLASRTRSQLRQEPQAMETPVAV